MKTKLELWWALGVYRFYLNRDRALRRVRPHWRRLCQTLRCAAYLGRRKSRVLRFYSPRTTHRVPCIVVNRSAYVVRRWGFRVASVGFLVSLLTHLPAPPTPNTHLEPVRAPYSHDLPEPPRVFVFRSKADHALLASCRDQLALARAQNVSDRIMQAIVGAEHYNDSTAGYVSASVGGGG